MTALRFGIGGRLYALLAVFALGCARLASGLIWLQNARAFEARQRQLGTLVDTAIGVLDAHRRLALSGAMTESEAKERALSILSSVRYGQGEYFFAMDQDMILLMNPESVQRIGKSTLDLTDKNGFAFNRDLQRQIKASGSGSISYVWNRPGSQTPIGKTSVAKLYAPWGFTVATGVYSDDLDADLWTTSVQAGGMTALLLVVLSVLAWLTGRNIVRPIDRLAADADRLAAGDTTAKFEMTRRRDEIGRVAVAVARFRDHVIEQQRLTEQYAEAVKAREEHNARIEAAVERFGNSVNEVLSDVGQNASTMRDTAKALSRVSGGHERDFRERADGLARHAGAGREHLDRERRDQRDAQLGRIRAVGGGPGRQRRRPAGRGGGQLLPGAADRTDGPPRRERPGLQRSRAAARLSWF